MLRCWKQLSIVSVVVAALGCGDTSSTPPPSPEVGDPTEQMQQMMGGEMEQKMAEMGGPEGSAEPPAAEGNTDPSPEADAPPAPEADAPPAPEADAPPAPEADAPPAAKEAPAKEGGDEAPAADEAPAEEGDSGN